MDRKSKYFKVLRGLGVAVIASGLSGCLVSLPPAVQYASYALDTVLYLETDKTTSGHALSAVTGQDCSLSRALSGYAVCQEDADIFDTSEYGDIRSFVGEPVELEDAPAFSYKVRPASSTKGMSLQQILNNARLSSRYSQATQ